MHQYPHFSPKEFVLYRIKIQRWKNCVSVKFLSPSIYWSTNILFKNRAFLRHSHNFRPDCYACTLALVVKG